MGTFNGTPGNDNGFDNSIVFGSEGDDQLFGFEGTDELQAFGGNDLLDGGTGNDTMKGGLGNDTYIVDSFEDFAIEDENGGFDTVKSLGSVNIGNQAKFVEKIILQGTGDTFVFGNSLDNTITGNSGSNHLNGDLGNDTLNGGDGNDFLQGDAGNDVANGGAGTDILFVSVAVNATISGTSVTGVGVNETFSGIEELSISDGAGDTTLDASSTGKKVTLFGSDGSDTLIGSSGVSKLGGGSGNDILIGKAGDDELTGSLGQDQYVYDTGRAFVSSDIGVDFLLFDQFADHVVLDKTTFKTLASGAGNGFSQANEFAKVTTDAAAATSGADIVYNSANGKLFYNQNGTADGFGTGAQFARFNAAVSISANNFTIQA